MSAHIRAPSQNGSTGDRQKYQSRVELEGNASYGTKKNKTNITEWRCNRCDCL